MCDDESDVVAALCQRLGIERPGAHLREALTHPSWSNEHPDEKDNQRLEFLGDSVLGVCASEMLVRAFPEVDEGHLTVMRASLVNGKALARAAQRLEIAPALRLGRGAEAAGERTRANVLADAVEAIIGAVYIDDGLGAARRVAERVIGDDLSALVEAGGIERDPKSRLQERLQAHRLAAPSYAVVREEGLPHERVFTVEVRFDVHAPEPRPESAEGQGRSKKAAEQAAARAALNWLGAHGEALIRAPEV
ncbi:MAG: ribonuclease III [Myxococcota bacterium]